MSRKAIADVVTAGTIFLYVNLIGALVLTQEGFGEKTDAFCDSTFRCPGGSFDCPGPCISGNLHGLCQPTVNSICPDNSDLCKDLTFGCNCAVAC